MIRMVTEMPKFDVVGIGVNDVDAFYCLPEGYQLDRKNWTEEAKIQAGGPAATASCLCAMLGWRTGFITPVGENMLSEIAKTEFVSRGVSADLFISYPQAKPVFSVVQIDPRLATRTIFSQLTDYVYINPADMVLDAVTEAHVLIADSYEPDAVMAALEAIQGKACRSVLDLESGGPEWLWRAIELGTDIIMPLHEARELTGEASPQEVLQALSKRTTAQLVVTNGSEGSWALTTNGIHHQAAFEVDARDTTGCGDVFHGAYAAGLLEGMSLALRLEFAAWMASMTATKVGGREALFSREQVPTQDLSLLSEALQAQRLFVG
ncbi:ribokinase [candidate division KSB3 bacterium]|nr:MAG: ribokinase [candidate division KSB3 bacterium]